MQRFIKVYFLLFIVLFIGGILLVFDGLHAGEDDAQGSPEIILSSIKIPPSQREKAQAFLLQNAVTYKPDFEDRYHVTHQLALDKKGAVIQEKLLRKGRAYLEDIRSSLLADFVRAEDYAIAHRKGIWSKEGGRKLLSPETVEKNLYSFQVLEGVVMQTAKRKDFLYLNFGPDWRTDFTVGVPKKVLKKFKKQKIDLENLAGKKIRVRGFIESYYGTFIRVDKVAQLTVF
ncbi:MAG: hypothetical protein ACTSXQ_05415 [Alphaproteobacteria bacterium]